MLLSLTLSTLLLCAPSFAAYPRRSQAIPSLLENKAPRLSPRDLTLDACGQLFQGNDTVFTALSVYNCLITVPFNQTVATQFLKYYKDTLEFQSTLTYLKNPPAAYQQSGVDLLGGLDRLQREVDTGTFSNQYNFEIALQDLIYSAHDGHLYLNGGATDIFSFGSPFYISSVSSDGTALPQIYITGDLIDSLQADANWTASPISTINGQDVIEYLTQFAAVNSLGYIDPHADWNNLMYNPAGDIQGLVNAFAGSTPFYPGDVFGLGFENGTGIGGWEWLAVLNDVNDQISISNASDFYYNFVVNSDSVPSSVAAKMKVKAKRQAAVAASASASVAASTTTQGLASSATAAPTAWPNDAFPQNPVITQPNLGEGGVLTGYFINNSIAVLSIPTFNVYGDDAISFSNTVGQFLQQSKAAGMTKVVIDLQQNYGGTRLLATDTFRQFFPAINPFGGGRGRAHATADVLGNTYTNYYNTYVNGLNESYYDYFTTNVWTAPIYLDAATGQNFSTWAEYYGPNADRLDFFTTIQRDNLSSIPFDVNNLDDVVYGYANRTANTTSPPFAAEDIVILTDSLCASTCSLFVEMMHYEAGVPTVAAGGLPQIGPIQARAGTRGARDYEADSLDIDIYTAEYLNDSTTNYLPDRSIDFRLDTANFNLQDQIRKGGNFPLQFIYEAANCRIFYTFDTFFNMAALWQYAADATWTNPSLCVQDSTGHLSSGAVTDTVGPSVAQKATWDATNPEIPSYAIDNATSINVAHLFVAGVSGPDDDVAGRLNALCTVAFPNCGQLTCALAPFCDTQRGIFYPEQFQCVKLCTDGCSSSETCGSGACSAKSGKCNICKPKSPPTSRTCSTRTVSNEKSVKNRKANEPKGTYGIPSVGSVIKAAPHVGKEVDVNTGEKVGGSGKVAKSIMMGFRG